MKKILVLVLVSFLSVFLIVPIQLLFGPLPKELTVVLDLFFLLAPSIGYWAYKNYGWQRVVQKLGILYICISVWMLLSLQWNELSIGSKIAFWVIDIFASILILISFFSKKELSPRVNKP